jgi:hypothetical protein
VTPASTEGGEMIIHGKITIRSLEALRPGETLKDSEIAGFEVRARSGGTKSYSLVYRAGRGRMAPQRAIHDRHTWIAMDADNRS